MTSLNGAAKTKLRRMIGMTTHKQWKGMKKKMGRCGAPRRSLANYVVLLTATLLVSFAVLSSSAKSRDVDLPDDDFEGASGPSSTDSVGLSDKLYSVEGRLLVGSSEEDPREGLRLLQQSSSPARVILYGNGNQQEVLTTADGHFRLYRPHLEFFSFQ